MITYFVSVLVFWGACLALYALWLHKEKFLQLNRVYLLFTFMLGLVIPLVKLPIGSPVSAGALLPESILLPEITLGLAESADPSAGGFSSSTLLLALFLAGSAWMSIRFFRHLFNLGGLFFSGNRTRFADHVLVENDRVSIPFSFLNLLFWNNALDADPVSAKTIRQHELAHIRQRHSLDLLVHEMTGIFFWWNPFWHVYGRELRNVHEYLADAAAIRESSVREYGQLLLQQCLGYPAPALSHGLKNHSQLKNRIAMMTKSRSPKVALAKYFLLLPVVVVLALAFSPPVGNQEVISVSARPDTVYQEVDQMPVFGDCSGLSGDALQKCSFDNLIKYIYTDLKYPADARKQKIQGTVVASFVVFADGHVGDVKIVKGITPSCDSEVERIVKAFSNWQPGLLDGKPVNVQMMLPVNFKLN